MPLLFVNADNMAPVSFVSAGADGLAVLLRTRELQYVAGVNTNAGITVRELIALHEPSATECRCRLFFLLYSAIISGGDVLSSMAELALHFL